MPLPIDAVQRAIKEDGFDGWLLYDFHGSNPIATRLAGLADREEDGDAAMVLPDPGRRGTARARARDRASQSRRAARREAPLRRTRNSSTPGLRDLLSGVKRVAMEYSAGNNIPYLSRVDAGTVEAVRQLGVDVGSSGDLVQRFEAVWSAEALPDARGGVRNALPDQGPRVRARARAVRLDAAHRRVPNCSSGWSAGSSEEGLYSADAPNVSAQENAGDPHYSVDPGKQPADQAQTRCCCSISGASCRNRARCLLTSRGCAFSAVDRARRIRARLRRGS